MHDSFLLQRIATSLRRICDENRLGSIRELEIEVNADSHIISEDLLEHLMEMIPHLVNKNTKLIIRRTGLEAQHAVIYMLKGDSLEA